MNHRSPPAGVTAVVIACKGSVKPTLFPSGRMVQDARHEAAKPLGRDTAPLGA